jgi:peptidoglycan/LPS O-acetylase OafA/YrhL
VVAVLALGLALVRVDAMPRSRPAPGLPGTAHAVAEGTAAAAVTALVAAPAGRDPLAAVPDDFAAVMGYTPVAAPTAAGTVRAAKPNGACSAPGGGTPFGFDRACRAHDYGYDLLRFANATGQPLSGEARKRLDAMFGRDLHARCAVARHGLAELGCHLTAELFVSGAAFNSWRQRYGNPGSESVPAWALGLVLPALAAPLVAWLRRWRRRLPSLAAATPSSRDRYVDFLRVVSIVTVVLGHWTMAAVGRSGDGLAAANVLSSTPWLWPATWVAQVMPVFFVVGGFSNLVSWQATRRRGGGYAEYLSGRTSRLLRPVLPLAAVWLVLPLVLGRIGLPAEQVALAAKAMVQPLWFLAVYLVVVALAPAMAALHRRFRLWVPVSLAAMAAGIDALRFGTGGERAGYLNVLVVWVLVHQVGFFYADGTLARLSRRALGGLGAAGLGALVILTGTGRYPSSMVGLPGEASNMSPPTVCIIALAVWQVALVMLARGRVSAWLARRGPWSAVIAVGSMAMTLYLWHVTAMVGLYGLVLALNGPLPTPGSWLWWATRPLWLALLALVLTPMALLLARFERPTRRPSRRFRRPPRCARPRPPSPAAPAREPGLPGQPPAPARPRPLPPVAAPAHPRHGAPARSSPPPSSPHPRSVRGRGVERTRDSSRPGRSVTPTASGSTGSGRR